MNQLAKKQSTSVADKIPFAEQVTAYLQKCNTTLNTPAKIVQMDTSWSLSRWSMTHRNMIVTIIIKEIASCVRFFMVKSPFEGEGSEEQLIELVDLIMTNYPDIKLSDVKLIFKKAKLGEYGETYNRLDGPTILRWFKKYYHIRQEHWIDYKEQQIRRQKDMERAELKNADPEGLKKLAKAFGKMASLHRRKKQVLIAESGRYNSLENYCDRNNLDYHQYMKDLDNEIDKYIKSNNIHAKDLIDHIYTWKRLQRLHQINKDR